LMVEIITVKNRACGINPPRIGDGLRRSIARGATGSLQYGHIRSFVVMKARHCGHMRRESMRS
jgi:hypothetical protein